jgi:hypothetical protein
MKRAYTILSVVLCILLFIAGFAADFKLYPGAKLDEKATREAAEAAAGVTDAKSKIYVTRDSFAQVAGFYKGIAREYAMPRASGTSGKPKKYEAYDLWEAYFIFDGAKDLAASKLWVKVQRPYIGEDVRDVTAIVMTERK